MAFGPPGANRQAGSPQSQSSEDSTLRFAEDGTFQITVFSDLHLGENPDTLEGPARDKRTADVVRKVLEHESSQLVVLNRDLISGYGLASDNATSYLDQILAPINDTGLPRATTYGNHDNESFSSTPKLFVREKAYSRSLTQDMLPLNPEAGVSNYYLLVFPASGDLDTPELILWFFDSRGGGDNRDWVDYVMAQAIAWFQSTRLKLNNQYNKTIPSLAFFHIPITGARDFQKRPGISPSRKPGINGEDVTNQGAMYGDSPVRPHDDDLMRALGKANSLLGVFSGHDHDNDWYFNWKDTNYVRGGGFDYIGIPVCYGRNTGYGGYGNLARGARQIFLNKDTLTEEVISWIRLDDGMVTENVTLNSTFGEDEYHPLPKHMEPRRGEATGAADSLHVVPSLYSAALCLFLIFCFPFRL
ncbi:Metallo-dependent phosphatase [Aspergillus heteromorphus CBS 117.55]|uniref:Metallo-dependent phosphatase n=1 Tax=Aspergillus heteromorphus CBS 117.55 TaxID=1448321 RepID=A0A317VGF3_9EURO|nr:Metallo-dependent phosphatase [Aspergillus heteromorphus CBS 117.55]PWY72995.1 Metallo-dependent phosphatase [Aspergillus heteromorphus CBS 117.55]